MPSHGAPMTGFGNHFATEAVPGALPVGRNSPQKVPFGLYAEQVSGTPFTAPRPRRRDPPLVAPPPAPPRPPPAVQTGRDALAAPLGTVRRGAGLAQSA